MKNIIKSVINNIIVYTESCIVTYMAIKVMYSSNTSGYISMVFILFIVPTAAIIYVCDDVQLALHCLLYMK